MQSQWRKKFLLIPGTRSALSGFFYNLIPPMVNGRKKITVKSNKEGKVMLPGFPDGENPNEKDCGAKMVQKR